jgi:hypothetical protein
VLDVVEHTEEALLVEVPDGERQLVVVRVAEPASGLVAGADELEEVVDDRGADRLGRLPRRLAEHHVVRRRQHLGDPVVVDPLAVDLAPVLDEGGLDPALQLDQSAPQLLVDLVRRHRVGDDLEDAALGRVGRLGDGGADRLVALAVGQLGAVAQFQLPPALLGVW